MTSPFVGRGVAVVVSDGRWMITVASVMSSFGGDRAMRDGTWREIAGAMKVAEDVRRPVRPPR